MNDGSVGSKKMKFRNKRTDEIKAAYSIELRDDKVYVKFVENGKEYAYHKDNIEVLDESVKMEKKIAS